MNKKLKFSGLFLALLLLMGTQFGNQAFALQCQQGRTIGGSSDLCYSSVTIASNETTLVSIGTVLVYDVSNAANSSSNGSYQARVATASTNGVFVAGIAQESVVSGGTTLALVRGRGDVAVNTQDALASGTAVFVGTSGNSTITTSTTQTQLGFALEPQTVTGGTPARSTKKAYITIV